jgi:alpha-glucosidase (family GH31 glycosyl hydrolase)
MLQNEYVPEAYEVASTDTDQLQVNLRAETKDNSFQFSFQTIRSNLFRTTFTSKEHPLPPHPSAPLPAVHTNGADAAASTPTPTSKRISIGDVVAVVDWSGAPLVSLSFANSDVPIHQDLPFRSYVVDGPGIAHYTRYNRGTLHLGLGEKAAPMDLSNRHFTLSATDCFGYDVYRTDPMYKHIPLLINATPNGCVGIFSTSHSRGFYSVGSEMDGLWGHFKVYRQNHGGLEQYLIVGRTLKEVVRTYAELVGYPLLVPRWAFGYIAGGMKYSMLDEPRACDALLDFAKKLKEHDIPCSAFQMSSGYTVAETEPKTRNVFTWNRHRFPDPKGFIDEYHRQGIRLIANVKPYVLSNHPEYEKLKAANAFFTDPRTGQSANARLWSAGGGESGIGGHIDFTSAAGFKWWYDGVKELKQLGIDCIWNDNNEYTLPNDYWQCALDEPSVSNQNSNSVSSHVGLWGRSLNTELMGKSSHDAALDVEPQKRPFILTRSATAGTMRYCASSWSGDNVTSWNGMKGANALSLTAGVCLMQVWCCSWWLKSTN